MTQTLVSRHEPTPLTQERRAPAFAGWKADWNRWAESDAARTAVARWRRASPVLRPFTTAERLLGAVGDDPSVPVRVAERRLLEVVRFAAAGDVDAARVVVARIAPGLIRLALRRTSAARRDIDDLFGEYLGAAWIAATRYPVARRPTKVAVNLLLDTEGLVHGRPPAMERRTASRHLHELRLPSARLDGAAADTQGEPLLTLLDLLRDARSAGLSDASLTMLVDLGVRGWTQDAVAARRGTPLRTVRWRRGRALQEIRARLDRDPLTGRPLDGPPCAAVRQTIRLVTS